MSAVAQRSVNVFGLQAIIALLADSGEQALNRKGDISPLRAKLSAELFGIYADAVVELMGQRQTPEECFAVMEKGLITMSNKYADMADLEDKGPYSKSEREELAGFFISHGTVLNDLSRRVRQDPLISLLKGIMATAPRR